MSNLSNLSGPKLQALIAARNARWSAALDATLRAGMGEMRHSDIAELARGSSLVNRVAIAREYIDARSDWAAAMDELDKRRDYHGSDKPIKARG